MSYEGIHLKEELVKEFVQRRVTLDPEVSASQEFREKGCARLIEKVLEMRTRRIQTQGMHKVAFPVKI